MPLDPQDGEPLDVSAILKALQDSGFNGWVSTEPFDYNPDPTTVARTALETLKKSLPS
jgi:sugar phosphate isomerase/epimerase